ncbi:MAG: UDP-N-acetylmuramoyl-tripeptide--D-alanyl-D-alanine ligase [Chlamydiae bacterium]|nr:UDP-N-acetylmuramoyl-tripeptide--D-alanyl-D-alanine ligase [Chlamydiota bacterium]
MLTNPSYFCVDSRHLKPDDIFVALPGDRVDGHDFLREAAQKNAAAAIVSENYNGPNFGLNLIRVPNTLLALQNLAQETLKKNRKIVVGVTGTVGKTTCKDFIATLLSGRFHVACTLKSQNSKISLPLTILNQSGRGEDILVLEMGMSFPGEIQRLTEIAPPDIVVITAISLVHAMNFDSLEEIARAKGEVLKHPKTVLGIIPEDEKTLLKIGSCRKQTFSADDLDINHLPKHHLNNAAAAIAVCRHLGLSEEEIQQRIPLLKIPKGRGTSVEKKGVLFINDAYNASPKSMKAALESMPASKGKRVAVLGEMLELGKFSEEAHMEVGAFALDHLDHLFCYGIHSDAMVKVWKEKGRSVQFLMKKNELLSALRKAIEPGDVVLLKGSNSCRLWEILEEF